MSRTNFDILVYSNCMIFQSIIFGCVIDETCLFTSMFFPVFYTDRIDNCSRELHGYFKEIRQRKNWFMKFH